MTWQDDWTEAFGFRPRLPGSREGSVQQVLAELITTCRRCSSFKRYNPTPQGVRLLAELWSTAFDEPRSPECRVPWFVNEFELPVPDEWRADIGTTYCCPDFAFELDNRLVIIELKTERGSYRPRQARDYLRVARHDHVESRIDLVLLGPHQPRTPQVLDERQRYSELIWADVVPALASIDSGEQLHLADALATFLSAQFPLNMPAPPARSPAEEPLEARSLDAVELALRLAPTVAIAQRRDDAQRGVDVPFGSMQEAQQARREVTQALADMGFADTVSAWVWRPESGGVPTTPAGGSVNSSCGLRQSSPRIVADQRGHNSYVYLNV